MPHKIALFGDYELDVATGELRQDGRQTVRLPEQPFRILIVLLERPGEVVTREELRKRLWPNATLSGCIKWASGPRREYRIQSGLSGLHAITVARGPGSFAQREAAGAASPFSTWVPPCPVGAAGSLPTRVNMIRVSAAYCAGLAQIRLKLGGSPSLADPFPEKPNGMHWRTYRRYYNKASASEGAVMAGIAGWLDLAEERVKN